MRKIAEETMTARGEGRRRGETVARGHPRRRIRVLYVIDTMKRMGTQVHIAHMIRGHDRTRFQPFLLCVQEKGTLGDELEKEGFPVAVFGLAKMYGPEALRSYPRFVSLLRRERIDIVHCYLFGAQVYGVPVARLSGVPLVIAGRRAIGAYWTRRRDIWTRRIANGFAHLQIGNSRAVREFVVREEGVPPEKMRVVYNGVDTERFSPAAAPQGAPDKVGYTAGYVGNFTEVKRVDVFLEAAKRLLPRFPRLRLLLVGAGPTEARRLKEGRTDEKLLARVERLGLREATVFRGFSERVRDELREMDIFVLPSASEGMSNALLEAMATGLPVIATDNGGNREVVVDGESGFLFPPGDTGRLAELMASLLADERRRREIGGNARARVLAHFTLDKMVRRMEAVYLDALRSKSAR